MVNLAPNAKSSAEAGFETLKKGSVLVRCAIDVCVGGTMAKIEALSFYRHFEDGKETLSVLKLKSSDGLTGPVDWRHIVPCAADNANWIGQIIPIYERWQREWTPSQNEPHSPWVSGMPFVCYLTILRGIRREFSRFHPFVGMHLSQAMGHFIRELHWRQERRPEDEHEMVKQYALRAFIQRLEGFQSQIIKDSLKQAFGDLL